MPRSKPMVKILTIRSSIEFTRQITDYCKKQDITVADLFRAGAKEYMYNHPVKPRRSITIKVGE